MNNLVPTFQQPASAEAKDEREFAANLLESKIGASSSKYRKTGRRSTAPDAVFDQHLSRVAGAIFKRDVITTCKDKGVTVPEEPVEFRALAKQLGIERETPYKVLPGIYRADERFTPDYAEAVKFGNALARVINFEGTVTIPIIETWHAKLAERYTALDGASDFIKLSDLSDEEIADEMDNADDMVIESAEAAS
jgi:hypothetical protein